MKKLFLIAVVLSVLTTGCNDNGFEDEINPSPYSYNNPSGLPKPTVNEIYYTTIDGLPLDLESEEGACKYHVIGQTNLNDSIFVLIYKDAVKLGSDGLGAFNEAKRLKSIRLPSGITRISSNDFFRAESLIHITLPEGIDSIGKHAFAYTSLQDIYIPKSVARIYAHAFFDCTLLSKVYITDLESWCKIDFYKAQSNPLANGAALYLNGKEVKNLVIPSSDSLTKIAPYAFRGCGSLSSLAMHNNITEIGFAAFENCKNLTQINLGSNVNIIGGESFRGCKALTNISIPENVTSIGNSAFSGCNNLMNVYCKAINPPVGGSGMFDYNAIGRKIYVPRKSVDAYKKAIHWSDYADDIVGYDF